MSSLYHLLVLLLLAFVTTAVIVQDQPLDPLEQNDQSDEFISVPLERQARAGISFKPAHNFMARFRMYSGRR
uniref:Uncharacterized protein n=1 Tax=Caenorhabditis japonica TaxID=281687 RepID=A0A8R1IL20_CAEJA